MLSFSYFSGKKTCQLSPQILQNQAIKKHEALHITFMFKPVNFNKKVHALTKYRIHSVSMKIWLADQVERKRLFKDGKINKLDPPQSRTGSFVMHR